MHGDALMAVMESDGVRGPAVPRQAAPQSSRADVHRELRRLFAEALRDLRRADVDEL